MARLRDNQLGVEVLGEYQAPSTDHIRDNQLGVEILGAYKGSHIRDNQLGVEVLGQWAGGGLIRANQLGVEILGAYSAFPEQPGDRIRVNQLGVEILRALELPPPAGDTAGYEYYIGPGFSEGYVPKKQPVSYEPQWANVQALVALGTLEGIGLTVQPGTVTGVPLTGSTPIQVTFPKPFNEACYFIVASYIPQNGDSTNIVYYGNPYPAGTLPTATGFELLGTLVAGSTPNTTGTFVYVAVGL